MLKSFLTTAAIVASSSCMMVQNKNGLALKQADSLSGEPVRQKTVVQNKSDLTLKQLDSLGMELVRQKQDYKWARLTCQDKEERDSLEKALRSTEDFLQSKDISVVTGQSGHDVESGKNTDGHMVVCLAVPGYNLRPHILRDNSPLIKRHVHTVPETSKVLLTPAQIDSAGKALTKHHYEAHKADFTPYHGKVDKDSIVREITLAKEFLARHQITMPRASLEFSDDQAKKQGVVDRVEVELQLPDGHTKMYNRDCRLAKKRRVDYQDWRWNF